MDDAPISAAVETQTARSDPMMKGYKRDDEVGVVIMSLPRRCVRRAIHAEHLRGFSIA